MEDVLLSQLIILPMGEPKQGMRYNRYDIELIYIYIERKSYINEYYNYIYMFIYIYIHIYIYTYIYILNK